MDAYAELDLEIGGHHERTRARLTRGQVFVDWERDESAGGCLLRAALVRRLLLLNARQRRASTLVVLTAGPELLGRLSDEHERLVRGVSPKPTLTLRLRFDGPTGAYTGGEEQYDVPLPGRGRTSTILRLRAQVRAVSAPSTSEQRSRAPS